MAEGLALYDLREKRILPLVVVFARTFQDRNPGDVPRPTGTVLEWIPATR